MALLTMCLPIAPLIERPPGVWEVKGSIPVGDSDFSFVLRSWRDKLKTDKTGLDSGVTESQWKFKHNV